MFTLTFKVGGFFKMNSESNGTWSGYRSIPSVSPREETKPENIFDTNLLVAKKEGFRFYIIF